jgi:hypothetical protein
VAVAVAFGEGVVVAVALGDGVAVEVARAVEVADCWMVGLGAAGVPVETLPDGAQAAASSRRSASRSALQTCPAFIVLPTARGLSRNRVMMM